MASGCPRQARLPLRWRLVFLSVYALHNAWNCWVFLNFSNFAPAKALLQSTDEQIGFITTVGWLGICATLPLVAVCSWHRTLLVAACLVNSLAPIVRYLTVDVCYQRAKGGALLVHNGQSCSYGLVVLSSFLSGVRRPAARAPGPAEFAAGSLTHLFGLRVLTRDRPPSACWVRGRAYWARSGPRSAARS